VTIALAIYSFLHVVNLKQPSISHRVVEMWSLDDLERDDLDLLRSRDVVSHATIGLAIYGLLYAVNLNQPSIWNNCREPQRLCCEDLDFWGHVTSSVT